MRDIPPVKEKSLSSEVQKIILRQGLTYLPRAMDTLGTLAVEAESHAVRVQASRAIINAMTVASSEMTENQAGSELLSQVREADHQASIETKIPKGIEESFDGN